MSTLFSCFFFTLLSLNPHSVHLYIIESPISFSGSMSPPQHAHFMTSKCHKDEILFLSLVFLAIGGICIFPLAFSFIIWMGPGVSERCFQIIKVLLGKRQWLLCELDRNNTRRFLQACFACHRYVSNGSIWLFRLTLPVLEGRRIAKREL